MYKCVKCKATLDELPLDMIRCPSCAGKILVKVRGPATKKIKAV